jgi:hypothetical protein
VPGDSVFFTVEINNKSSNRFEHVRIKLKQKVRKSVQSLLGFPHEHTDIYKIGSSMQSPKMVNPYSKEVWEGFFEIPDYIVPTTSDLITGGMVQVDYFFELESNLSLFEGDFRLPITIGMLPLMRRDSKDIGLYQRPLTLTEVFLKMKMF